MSRNRYRPPRLRGLPIRNPEFERIGESGVGFGPPAGGVARTPRVSHLPRHLPRRSITTASASQQSAPDYARFAIGFDQRDRARLHALIDQVLDSGRWTEAELTDRFEAAWEASNEVPAVAVSSWTGGAMAALHFARVQGETVLCPSNTFMATPLAAVRAGAHVEFVDCNREDLCISFADFEAQGGPVATAGRVRGPHRRPHRVRDRADRRLLRRGRDLPDRGLRPRARCELEWAQAGELGRRGRLLAVRDQDDLDRRRRGARLAAARGGRNTRARFATTASQPTPCTA